MLSKVRNFRIVFSAALIVSVWLTPISAAAQDLVAVSSISGNSSVFIFPSASRSGGRTAAVKPTRTKAQRLDSVTRIKKQYETIAKVNPRREKAKIVDPYNLPKNINVLPAAAGSKLFAGVGEYYVDKADYDKAIEFFRDAVKLDDKNTSAKSGYSE